MRVGVIIFCRCSSTRFPNKAFCEIKDKCMIELVCLRARKIKSSSGLVLATSIADSDNKIAFWAKNNNIQTFRGPLTNVLQRAVMCAKKFKFDAFYRICGDRPFHSPKLGTQAISDFKKNPCDLMTSNLKKTLPKGLTIEVISTEALASVINDNPNMIVEHITQPILKNPKKYKIVHLKLKNKIHSRQKWSIDTPNDLKRINRQIKHIKNLLSFEIS